MIPCCGDPVPAPEGAYVDSPGDPHPGVSERDSVSLWQRRERLDIRG